MKKTTNKLKIGINVQTEYCGIRQIRQLCPTGVFLNGLESFYSFNDFKPINKKANIKTKN